MLVSMTSVAHAQLAYQINELGVSPAGSGSSSFGINNNNIVGHTGRYLLDFLANNFIATMPPLVTFSPTMVALNDGNFAAGSARTSSSANTNRAVLYNPTTNTTTDLGSLGGTNRTDAFAMNDNNQVVGTSRLTSSTSSNRAAWFTGTSVINLATTGFAADSSNATGINNSNVIVGNGKLTGDAQNQPLVFNGFGGASKLTLLPGDTGGNARAISDNGVIVGHTNLLTADTQKAVAWIGTSSTPIPLQGITITAPNTQGGSSAQGVNENGEIVGNSNFTIPEVGTIVQAYRWTTAGPGANLNDCLVEPIPGAVLRVATHINDSGRIIVTGTIPDPSDPETPLTKTFILTPVPVQIAGQVNLLQYSGPLSGLTARIELLDSAGMAVDAKTVTLNATGKFSVNWNVLPGARKFRAICRVSLSESVTVNVGSAVGAANVNFSPLNGDIDRDGEVGPGDFEIVVANFGNATATAEQGDADGDGEVGPGDFEIIVANFGSTGS